MSQSVRGTHIPPQTNPHPPPNTLHTHSLVLPADCLLHAMAAPIGMEGALLLVDHLSDFDILSLDTSSSSSFSLCLSPTSRSPTPSSDSTLSSPAGAGPLSLVAHSAPSSPRPPPHSSCAQSFTPLFSLYQQQQQPNAEPVVEREPLLFELDDDALIQSDLSSSLSPQPADVAIVDTLHTASIRDDEQQRDEYMLAEADNERRGWDDDSDCSDVSSTSSAAFANDRGSFSTSLPATASSLTAFAPFTFVPFSLPTSSATVASSSIVAQWLRFHHFPGAAIQRLNGYTCSDLFALTKDDAKELLGVTEGIKLYHRIQACKQRTTARTHSRLPSAVADSMEHDSKYSNSSSDSSLHSSAVPSPVLIRPSALASIWRQRAQAAALHRMAASGVKCGVMGCVGSSRRWLGCCGECGRSLCGVHACKSLWTSTVYCPRCYGRDSAWVRDMCVIA